MCRHATILGVEWEVKVRCELVHDVQWQAKVRLALFIGVQWEVKVHHATFLGVLREAKVRHELVRRVHWLTISHVATIYIVQSKANGLFTKICLSKIATAYSLNQKYKCKQYGILRKVRKCRPRYAPIRPYRKILFTGKQPIYAAKRVQGFP